MSAPQRRSAGKHTRLGKAERKRQLQAHARQLFVTLGYQHTTTEKIAQAAGVTEPVLYRHFESKKAIFLEVLDEIRRATQERWESATAALHDPLLRLQTIVQLYLGSATEHVLETRLMHRTLIECDDPDIAASLRAFYLGCEDFLARILRDGQAAGVFRPDLDPRVVAWELIRTGLGFTLMQPLGIPVHQEPDFVPRTFDFVVRYLLTRPHDKTSERERSQEKAGNQNEGGNPTGSHDPPERDMTVTSSSVVAS